jgi:hypothetical protein
MLNGKIKVMTDLLLLGHQFKKSIGEIRCLWKGVKDSDPAEAFHFDEALQEFFKIGTALKIFSVSSRILSDQDEFLDPLIPKSFCLIDHGSDLPASIRASDLGDRAKGAAIRTAFCNLEIGDERRGGKDSRCLFIVKKS